MPKKYVMALDEGTTSCRCILFDKEGNQISVAQKEFKQIFPKAGWVEHDAMEIWSTQIGVAEEAMAKVGAVAEDVAGIGITNQRETTVVWDKETGLPVYNAIVWQCRRTAQYCDELTNKGYADSIKEKTGLLIDAYFSGTKLHWILENVPGRSYVLIHFGNFPENTSGCILVGDGFKDLNSDQKTDITNSRSAMRMLLNEIGPSCELELLIEEVN